MFRSHSGAKKKVESNDDAPFDLTTELVLMRSIERGLSLKDFEDLTMTMIMNYIITYNNEKIKDEDEEDITIREATQADYDRW